MSVPLEYVREQIVHVLRASRALSVHDLVTAVNNHLLVLADKESPWDPEGIKETIQDMVAAEALIHDGNMVHINFDRIRKPENAFYRLANLPHYSSHENLDGSVLVTSANSDDFYFNYAQLADNEIIQVELIPEPNNPVYEQAIAIVYMEQILGYLERHVCRHYFDHLIRLQASGVSAIATARVIHSTRVAGHKYLDLHLRPLNH